MRPACEFCEQPVDPRKPGTFRKVMGWAEVRTGGGIHGISDRIELYQFACNSCMKLRRLGVPREQGALFGGVR